jgi:hypothetical protein
MTTRLTNSKQILGKNSESKIIELKIAARDVFIEWNGPNVPQIEKGKKKSHLGEIKELLQVCPNHQNIVCM